jgi:hypothetical protein
MVGASLTKIIFGHFSFEITWLDPKLNFFFIRVLKLERKERVARLQQMKEKIENTHFLVMKFIIIDVKEFYLFRRDPFRFYFSFFFS